jgi:hypothetical protein
MDSGQIVDALSSKDHLFHEAVAQRQAGTTEA